MGKHVLTKKYLRECNDLAAKKQIYFTSEIEELQKRIKKLTKYIEEVQANPLSLLIYEYDLPKDMREVDYVQWLSQSFVVDGVRMGLPLK